MYKIAASAARLTNRI